MMNVHQFSVHYGDRYVFDHASLHLEKGDTLLLYGGTGSGKTTFVRSLLGIHTDYEGSIHLDGKDMRMLSKKERSQFLGSTGIVLEEASLIPSRSVLHNLIFGSEARAGQAQIMLQFLHILPLKDRLAHTLSPGEKRLVEIGRALLKDPKLLVWDSPFRELDASSVQRILHYLSQLHQSKKTILITSSEESVQNAFRSIPFVKVYDIAESKFHLRGVPTGSKVPNYGES